MQLWRVHHKGNMKRHRNVGGVPEYYRRTNGSRLMEIRRQRGERRLHGHDCTLPPHHKLQLPAETLKLCGEKKDERNFLQQLTSPSQQPIREKRWLGAFVALVYLLVFDLQSSQTGLQLLESQVEFAVHGRLHCDLTHLEEEETNPFHRLTTWNEAAGI